MFIYIIENKLNGKSYVGQTVMRLERRIKQHFSVAANLKTCRKQVVSMAIARYGAENFSWRLLETCASAGELNDAERRWIASLNSRVPNGYNVDLGGASGQKVSSETRLKIAASKVGRSRSDEVRAKVSAGLMGKKLSSEAIRKRTLTRSITKPPKPKVAAAIRDLRGELNPRSRLSWSEVRAARQILAQGLMSQRALARKFGISQGVMNKIANNKSWIEDSQCTRLTGCGTIQSAA